MKKTITILFIAFTTIATNAAVITVSNNPDSPGQYTDLQVAITAATNNDTLYVHGSPNSYGTVYLTKPLTIIGAGALPNKIYSFPTIIAHLDLGFNGTFTSSGSGSKVFGCDIGTLYFRAGNGILAGISNVTIARNRVYYIYFYQSGTNTALAHNSISIFNNVINSIAGYQIQAAIKNTVIKNNILANTIDNMGHEAVGSWILTNNIISGYLSTTRSVVISNNVFFSNGSAFFATNAYCSVSNNCFFSTTYTHVISNIIFGTNTGGNNLLNQDPLFAYYDPTVFGYSQTSPVAGPFANFNLQVGSPCLLSGSDALDIGIYGGPSPFQEGYPADSRYRYFIMPSVPQMLQMNIQNAAILPAGTLNVNFKASKQH